MKTLMTSVLFLAAMVAAGAQAPAQVPYKLVEKLDLALDQIVGPDAVLEKVAPKPTVAPTCFSQERRLVSRRPSRAPDCYRHRPSRTFAPPRDRFRPKKKSASAETVAISEPS
jgi:hypothetical protein